MKNIVKYFERLLFLKIELWGVLLLILLGAIIALMSLWAVLYVERGGFKGGRLGEAIHWLAETPGPLVRLINDRVAAMKPTLIPYDDWHGLEKNKYGEVDDEFLLISEWSDRDGQMIIRLLDLGTGLTIHKWMPPVEEIVRKSSYKGGHTDKWDFRAAYPFMFSNGDVIFHAGEGPLAKISKCNEVIFVSDRHFHHSIEPTSRDTFFIPAVIADPKDYVSEKFPFAYSVSETDFNISPLRDDSVVEIDSMGNVINEFSVVELLIRHGYTGLLYGVGPYLKDRIHLNDVEPIEVNDEFVQSGDLALSIRNLSTVLLYRPKTDEIVWLKTGPWLNQHDVDYLGNGVFSIFGNDTVYTKYPDVSAKKEMLAYYGYSSIYEFDQRQNKVTKKFELDSYPWTAEQGQHKHLSDGSVFLDLNSLLYKISSNKQIIWRYNTPVGNKHIAQMNWPRHISGKDFDEQAFKKKQCS